MVKLHHGKTASDKSCVFVIVIRILSTGQNSIPMTME